MKALKFFLIPYAIIMLISVLPMPTEPPPEPPHITVMLGGDVLIWSGVARAFEKGGADAVISSALAEHFRNADIAMVNLEMAVSKRGEPMEDKLFTFRGRPEHLSLLQQIGIDAVSVANNHTLDYGRKAFLDTLIHLKNANIAPVGGGANIDEASAFHTIEIQGRKVGILAASRVVPSVSWYAGKSTPGMLTTYDPKILNAAIEKAKETCDFVIVYVHWGIERESMPEKYQQKLAHGYIDAGADAVFGSHPHVPQGFEIYNGKPIAYSLGNFIFTSSKPDTVAVRLNLTDDEVWLEVLPCRLKSPHVGLTEDAVHAAKQLETLEKISFGIQIDENGRVCASE